MAEVAQTFPKGSSGLKTNYNILTTDRLAKECVLDRKKEIVLDLPPILVASLVGSGAGAAPMAAMNSTLITSITFATTDTIGFRVWHPDTIDLAEDIYFAVAYSNSAVASAGTALFAMEYTEILLSATAGAANAVGAAALDTPIPSDVNTPGAEYLTWTEWGVLDGGSLAGKPGIDALNIEMTMTLGTITDASMTAIMMEFGRKYI